jgi:hypothetical protein
MRAYLKYIAISMLVFVVLLSASISVIEAGVPHDSHFIEGTGTVHYPSSKIGIYESSWNFKEYNANTIASTFDMSQSWWVGNPPDPNDYSAKMNQVHALNPDYKFLLYRNCMSIYSYWVDEWNYAKSQGWLLKDAYGNYVTESNWGWSENYMVDITNKSYQQWLGAKVKSWLDQYPPFDGVMADNSLKYSAQEFAFASNTRPINPLTSTYFTDMEILDGCAGMLNAIIDTVGPNKLAVANGIWSGFVWNSSDGDGYRYVLSKVPRLKGLGSEGCFRPYSDQWYSETDWLSSINMVSWVQNNFLNASGRYFIVGCPANPLPNGATTEQVMMYGFCSMLLSIRYSSPQNSIYFAVDYWNTTKYPTELQLAQRLRSLDLSEPLGDYFKITSTSLYARDFAKSKVLVNPSGLSYTVTLEGSYKTINDSVVSGSLTVYAHSGVILFK